MSSPVPVTPVKLAQCPQCAYSLQGLPAAGRCPECGFAYDERTFILRGISRGMSTIRPGRAILWIIVGLTGAFAPQFLIEFAIRGMGGFGMAMLGILAVLWGAAFIYLLVTGKRERKGMEEYLFSAGGFGPCSASDTGGFTDTRMTPWSAVSAIAITRSGPTWHFLQIGRAGRRGRLADLKLNAGVRCDAAQAQWVRQTIEARIQEAWRARPG